MGESKKHIMLVCEMVNWIASKYLNGQKCSILVDTSNVVLQERSLKVGGYIPDAYVSSAIMGKLIVGEAKTAKDLMTPHSLAQISSFLIKCSHSKDSLFVLAVPWDMIVSARNLLKYLIVKKNIKKVKTVVIEKLIV